MIALFVEPIAHGFFVRFVAGRLQQLNGFAFEGLTQITEGLRAKLSFLLLECDGGTQHGPPLRIRSPHPVEGEGLWLCGWLYDDGRSICVGAQWRRRR